MIIVKPMAHNSPQISNCAIWLDSDSGITLVDGKVSLWADKSGNGRNISHDYASGRPTYVTNQLNGHSIVSFDGSDDRLMNSSLSGLEHLTGFSYFGVLKYTSEYGNYIFQFYMENPDSETYGIYGQSEWDSTSIYYFVGAQAYLSSPGGQIDKTKYNIISDVYNGSGTGDTGRFKSYVNGTEVSLSYAGYTVPSSMPMHIGKITLGCGYLGGAYPKGCSVSNWAEFIFYNKVLTETERKQVITYLGWKYAISVS